MRLRLVILTSVAIIFLVNTNSFLANGATETLEQLDIKQDKETNKLLVSYSKNMAPSYEVLVDSNEKYTINQSYSWIRDQTSRYNLVSYSLDDSDFIPISRKARGNFTLDINMETSHSVVFLAVPQFPLAVSGTTDYTYSPPSPTGDNWFDAGTTTTVTVNPSNQFLIRNVIDGWEGTFVESKDNSVTILIDGSHSIEARWKTDYSQLIVIGIIPLSLGIFFAIHQRKKSLKIGPLESKLHVDSTNEEKHRNDDYAKEMEDYLSQKFIEKLDSMRNLALISDLRNSKIKEKLEREI